MAGVHPATASRALNQQTESLVNAETAARIKKIAAEMGYSPNPIARSLKTSRSASIGLVIPDLKGKLAVWMNATTAAGAGRFARIPQNAGVNGAIGAGAGTPAWSHVAALAGFTMIGLGLAFWGYRREEDRTW